MIDDNILKAFLTLILIVGGLAGLFFLLKKFNARAKGIDNNIGLHVVSKISLQSKTHLYIVKAGEKILLIGVSDHNIRTLADLTDQEEKLPGEIKKAAGKGVKMSGVPKPIDNSKTAEEASLSFKSFLRSSLRKSN